MAFQIAEILTLLAFMWTFGKVQMDINARIDARQDISERQQAVIIEGQNYLKDMLADRLDLFEGKLNLLNARISERDCR